MPYRSKSELALSYFPDHPVTVAVQRLRYEIVKTDGLLTELKKVGYKSKKKYFSPRELEVVFHYLGEP